MDKYGINESDITSLVQTVLDQENIKDGEITIKGTTGAGDGYTGIVIFVDANGTKDGEKVTLNLAVKHSTTVKSQRDVMPIKGIYKTESTVYETVIPKYQNFLKEHELPLLDIFAKWYKTEINEAGETIVFDNLKVQGFEMHDVKTPMNLNHLRLLLDKYARFHATGFAFKIKNPDEFKKIASILNEPVYELNKILIEYFNTFNEHLQTTLKSMNEFELVGKVKDILYEDLLLKYAHDKHSIVTHADCWNNNLIFKYKKGNTHEPEEVKLLDWQVSSVGSPMIDLIQIIFLGISTEDLKNVDDLINYYYLQFSDYLNSLGCDVQDVYPKDEFMEDWHSYAKYSTCYAPTLYAMADKDRIEMDLSDLKNIIEAFEPSKDDQVKRRTLELVKYLADKKMI
ncbi:unnamed protein product [Brassicogethes aeneus]|uniref:CHK kinase-like domain-containing protein n=2 Tax=Brassicogethes aeneus TaxID=1431903 RepID=A0A9P0AWT0_BRAAE|nr:unnamed protein product [Brassicogethes aeneus]